MNKKCYIFLIVFFINCYNSKNNNLIISYNYNENKNLLISNILFNNINLPSLEKNLKIYLQTKIILEIYLYSNNKFIHYQLIERIIKYDKWNNFYILNENENNINIFYNFFQLKEKYLNFENIQIELPYNIKKRILKYRINLIIKTIELIPPLKLFEFNKKFGNLRINNLIYKTYVE